MLYLQPDAPNSHGFLRWNEGLKRNFTCAALKQEFPLVRNISAEKFENSDVNPREAQKSPSLRTGRVSSCVGKTILKEA